MTNTKTKIDDIEVAAKVWNQASYFKRRSILNLAGINFPGNVKYRFDSLGALNIGKIAKAVKVATTKARRPRTCELCGSQKGVSSYIIPSLRKAMWLCNPCGIGKKWLGKGTK